MADEQHNVAGLHYAIANDGPHDNADTAPAATSDNAPNLAAHDAAAAVAAMGDE